MKEKYITATEAAKQYGLSNSYVAKLAKRAKQQGEPLLKKEKAWLAPSEVWDRIINNPGMIPRKKRKKLDISKTLNIKEQEELLSAAKAAKKYGISSNWAAKLARRSKEQGFEYPQKVGTVWMAPYSEWEKVFKSKKLKKWTKKR
jgi:transposase